MDPNRLVSASLLILTLALLSHPVQCLSRTTLSDEATSLRFEVTEAPDQREELELEILPDFGEIVQAYNEKEKSNKNSGKTEDNSWRIDKSFAERLEHMRNLSKLTDCLFVVGDDGNTTKFEAHKLVLMAASPVFEAVFANRTIVRVRGWTSEEFSALLNFIYSGDLCIGNFEVACTLLYHANSLQLNGVTDTARGFIYNHMYPDHLWKAYHCAKSAADQDLFEAAKELISEHTSQTFKDRAFNDLSRDDLASLLARDDLNVKSEVEVFEAITRWGLMRVLKEGKTPSPELIREKIGAAVLKQIRFLTMTGIEFSRVHTSAQLLTYEEGLAILLNINNPGVLEMPKSLSSLTQKRKNRATITRTLKTFGVYTSTLSRLSLHWGVFFLHVSSNTMSPFFAAIFLLGLCLANAINFKTIYEWDRFDFILPNGQIKQNSDAYLQYMAVFGERLILSLRKDSGVPAQLVWLPTSGTSTALPKLAPFPSSDFYKRVNCDSIQWAKGMETDTDGRLWVLDQGSDHCPSKIWIFDLVNHDTTERVHQFPDTVASHSYNNRWLIDIVLDKTPDDQHAFIIDSKSEHIIVYSRKTDKSWSVKTPGKKWVHSALSPNREAGQLYLGRALSDTLYSVSVSELKNEGGSAAVKLIGKWTRQPNRMLIDTSNVLYAAFYGQSYTSKWNISEPFREQRFYEVGQLDAIQPFTLALDTTNTLWMTERNQSMSGTKHKLLKAAAGA
ncbi:Hypothetical predicted protein [Cloeon dipterum]|uniref:BTB domain-containing protein n=1 Tax=Cloeon dipterum TaxID=197152 RepID=A0A8S1CLY7_9INSE|nr:Hypothetical predicted protein [Cloeon dipterum]